MARVRRLNSLFRRWERDKATGKLDEAGVLASVPCGRSPTRAIFRCSVPSAREEVVEQVPEIARKAAGRDEYHILCVDCNGHCRWATQNLRWGLRDHLGEYDPVDISMYLLMVGGTNLRGGGQGAAKAALAGDVEMVQVLALARFDGIIHAEPSFGRPLGTWSIKRRTMRKNEFLESARRQLRALVAKDLRDRNLSYRDIAARHGCTEKLVGNVASEYRLARRPTKEGASSITKRKEVNTE